MAGWQLDSIEFVWDASVEKQKQRRKRGDAAWKKSFAALEQFGRQLSRHLSDCPGAAGSGATTPGGSSPATRRTRSCMTFAITCAGRTATRLRSRPARRRLAVVVVSLRSGSRCDKGLRVASELSWQRLEQLPGGFDFHSGPGSGN